MVLWSIGQQCALPKNCLQQADGLEASPPMPPGLLHAGPSAALAEVSVGQWCYPKQSVVSCQKEVSCPQRVSVSSRGAESKGWRAARSEGQQAAASWRAGPPLAGPAADLLFSSWTYSLNCHSSLKADLLLSSVNPEWELLLSNKHAGGLDYGTLSRWEPDGKDSLRSLTACITFSSGLFSDPHWNLALCCHAQHISKFDLG